MKVKVYVHAAWDSFGKKFDYTAWPYKSDAFGVLVLTKEIDAPEVDETELKSGVVKFMRAEQQKIRAEAEVKYQNIEQQIQELLCIEDKSAVIEQSDSGAGKDQP